MNVTQDWLRIRSWLAQHAPEVLANLNPPATARDFAALEKRIGAPLPADFREVYSVHNGEQGMDFFAGTEFLSIDRILDEWDVWNDLLEDGDLEDNDHGDGGPGVKSNWWNPLWIPLSYNGAGDHVCLDLDPGPGGTRGQLIEMWHDAGDRPRIAGSLGEWLHQFANRLEAGEFEYSQEHGLREKQAVA